MSAYLVFFGSVFIGIASVASLIWALFSPSVKKRRVFIGVNSCENIEYKVRMAVRDYDEVILIVPDKLKSDGEFRAICRALCADYPEVRIMTVRKNKRKGTA